MGQVKIDYSDIYDAAKKARSISDRYEDFASDLQNDIVGKMLGIPGNDSRGYVSGAQSIVSAKVRELRQKKNQFSSLASNIERLADHIENREKNVVSSIERIAEESLDLKKQSWWESFSQWLYGTFCVDFVNWNPITRAIGDGIKKVGDAIQDTATKVMDWFKHGEGKYYLEIVMTIGSVIGSVAGTVLAITAAVATGGAAAPLVVAAVASTIATMMEAFDAGFTIAGNIEALKIEAETDDPGRARYYGNIDGFSGFVERTDLGDQATNENWGTVGKIYDVVEVAAQITAVTAGTIGSAGLTGKVIKDPRTGKKILKTEYDPSKIVSNLKNTVKEKIGFRNNGGKWSFDLKNLFRTENRRGTMAELDLFKKNLEIDEIGRGTYKGLNTVKKITGFPGKLYKTVTNIETVTDDDISGLDKAKTSLEILGGTEFNISSPVNDLNDTINTINSIFDLAS